MTFCDCCSNTLTIAIALYLSWIFSFKGSTHSFEAMVPISYDRCPAGFKVLNQIFSQVTEWHGWCYSEREEYLHFLIKIIIRVLAPVWVIVLSAHIFSDWCTKSLKFEGAVIFLLCSGIMSHLLFNFPTINTYYPLLFYLWIIQVTLTTTNLVFNKFKK